MTRTRHWREPPILFQILVLLLGSLVISQLVTLLLTLVLPPAPPAQHSMEDVVSALQGAKPQGHLTRVTQAGPPDAKGPGWFSSAESRHDLALRLGAADEDVRLAFYAPLPFAGITAPPPHPPMPMMPVVWHVSPEPLRPMSQRLVPIALILDDGAPGGGGGGGNRFGGGFQGMPGGMAGGMPGAMPGRDGSRDGMGFPGRGGMGGNRGGQGFGGGRGGMGAGGMGGRGGVRGGTPSPGDLDRQPLGPVDAGPGFGDRIQPGYSGRDPWNGRVPTEGFDPRNFPAQVATPPAPTTLSPADLDRQPVAPPAPTSEAPPARAVVKAPTLEPRPEAVATPEPTPAPVTPQRRAAVAEPEARPIPLAAPSRGLFGLAPAPFVEGDFVAALRQPDGHWTVVRPHAEAFPNAWQRRVMLWFLTAFAIVAPIGWLFARHILRPLERFTTAAEQLGRDPSAALVALEGPAEIGRAAHAFNVMQSRLRSFVDDRTAMVGAISHDLRTPLTRMRFRIEEVEDEAVREGMSQEVTEMEAMITSVLAFIRDASTPNARERLDLSMLVDDVVQDAAMVGGDVTIEKSASAPVEVDVLGMRRLLANLVENALKYGHRARIRVDIEEDAAVAEIIDDGPGLPEEELERAFEPFYRASNVPDPEKGGFGLGLAVCRSIARAHGGDVRLHHSAEGFAAELRLPLAYQGAANAASLAA